MTPPRAPKAVIFDWDNTLVDSFPAIHGALVATLVAMGHEPWTFDETRARARRSLRDSFPDLFGARWEEARDHFYRHFAAHHMRDLQPIAGAQQLLEALATAGCPMGVVSNKMGSYLRAEIEALGWSRYFLRAVGAQDATSDKPHPECVALVLAAAGLAAAPEIWLVGDTALDMECAHAAGVTAVLVGNTGDDISRHPPAHRVGTLPELGNLITKFWAGLVTECRVT
jgi:phosphoglycolate phosphatase